ncbi:MAG: hypothetical protein FJX77_16150, partial [Armatimonadetes bacterium]|nr:hypothetical protein [Armatimonadota bacterium]
MPARWRILVGCLLLALGCQAAQNTGANRPWQLRVRVGGEQYGGLLLNTLGHVMAPLGPGANAMWQAEYEGEVYPLRVVSEER